jgi:hypothetical protein
MLKLLLPPKNLRISSFMNSTSRLRHQVTLLAVAKQRW